MHHPRPVNAAARRMPRSIAVLVAGTAAATGLAVALRAAEAPAPARFFLGADVSALDAPERGRWAPLPVYQENGRPGDELTILHRHGWNAFRLRVFVSPVREAPDNTLEAAIPLAQRIKSLGATFLLDLHFSDTWADPQHQEIPVAWRGLDIAGMEKAWEAHAHDAVARLRAAGAAPDWVQIGNEITRGTEWPLAQVRVPGSTKYNPPPPYDEARQWDHLTRLLKAGIRGVRSAAGDHPPRIAIHIDRGADWPVTRWFFDHLGAAHVDYDIIAQSFYPEWNHGTLEQLEDNMNRCAARYHKDFLVVETGYGASHVPDNPSMRWPETPAGRLQFMADLIHTIEEAPRAIGAMYWAPEREAWNADGTPGPVVFVLDRLNSLTARPASHAPADTLP